MTAGSAAACGCRAIRPPAPARVALAAAAALALAVGRGRRRRRSDGDSRRRSPRASAAPRRRGPALAAPAGRPAARVELRRHVGARLPAPPAARGRDRRSDRVRHATRPRRREWRASPARCSGPAHGARTGGGGPGGRRGAQRCPFAGPAPAQPAQGSPPRCGARARRRAPACGALGVNVNLAPVADVAAGAGLGHGRAGVRREARARWRRAPVPPCAGCRRGRVAATAKHFPGLGAAALNTDDGPVTVDAPRAMLEARPRPVPRRRGRRRAARDALARALPGARPAADRVPVAGGRHRPAAPPARLPTA